MTPPPIVAGRAPSRVRLAFALVIALGVALRLPALRVERLGDDWYHVSMAEGTYPVHRAPWDLYAFVRDTPDEHRAFQRRGTFPWWVTPELKLAPWRPLASVLLWCDIRLFGRGAVASHALSLAVWALLLVAASRWLRAVLPWGAALVALSALCLDESATVPIAWIANRPSLLATAFGLLGAARLVAHRDGATPRAQSITAMCFALSVLSGEYGLAVTAAAVAFELVARAGPLRARRVGLGAAVLPCVLYLLAWKALGYGARGTVAYVDPLSSPGAWLSAAGSRALSFAAELIATTPVMVTAYAPRLAAAALVVPGVVGVVTLLGATAAQRRVALAFAAGAAVAVVPVLSAPLNGRVLLSAEPWFAGLLGALAAAAWTTGRSRVLRAALGVGIALHLVAAPWRAWTDMRELTRWRADRVAWRPLPGVDACHRADQDHILLAAGGFGVVHTLPLFWQAMGCVQPRSWRVLAAADGATFALRTAADTLEVRGDGDAPMLGGHALVWRLSPPLVVGQRITTAGFAAHLLAMRGERPTRVAFTFDRPLDDARVVLWVEVPGGFAQVTPPPIGAGRLLPRGADSFW